jgi:hypothetical protein
VYASTEEKERVAFFKQTILPVPPLSRSLIGGDWNSVVEVGDRVSDTQQRWRPLSSTHAFREFVDNHSLHDTTPKSGKHTFTARATKTSSLLDRWLVENWEAVKV